MSVKLNSTGGGSVTLDSPSTASNYTVTLPSAAGTLATTTGTGSVFTNPTINGFTGDTSAITVGTTQFIKDTSGNIGIGVSPTSLLTTVSSGQVQIGTTSWPTSFVGKSNARTIIGNEGTLMLWNEAAAALGNAASIYLGPKGSGTNGSTIIAGGAIAGVSESNSTNNGALTFATNGGSGNGERMRLDSSGNLGLGVTPSTYLTGTPAIQFGAVSTLSQDVNSTYLGANATTPYGRYLKTGNYAVSFHLDSAAGSFKWFNSNGVTGTAGNIISPNQAMTLDASGNLGIGTSSPNAPLSFANYVAGTAGLSNKIQVFNGGGASIFGFGLYTGQLTYNCGDGAHVFYTGGATPTERARIDSSGALTVPNIYTNTTAAVTYVAVSSAGLLQRGGVSALKYKQDIRDLESIDITKFRPVRYKSKCENDDQTIDYFGFIADEVEEAGFKELITYNDDGEPEGFQYERMTVVLLKAIQELSAQNQALEARLAQLEAK
jgi:hypothetical protein